MQFVFHRLAWFLHLPLNHVVFNLCCHATFLPGHPGKESHENNNLQWIEAHLLSKKITLVMSEGLEYRH